LIKDHHISLQDKFKEADVTKKSQQTNNTFKALPKHFLLVGLKMSLIG